MEKLFLACDGGGTKAEFVVIKENGKILMHFKMPGNNPNFGGMDKTKKCIENGIKNALDNYPEICSIFIGNAGLLLNDNKSILNSYLLEKFPNKKIKCDTDLVNLINLSPCKICLILGTGIVVAVKEGNGFIQYGGKGHLIDKGGSGYHIGKDALDSKLVSDKTVKCGDSRNAIYAKNVFDLYKKGNEIAITILERNAKCVAELLNEVFTKEGKENLVFVSGGLVEHFGDIYLPIIKKFVEINFVTSDLPQIFGASKKCIELFGNMSNDFEDNFIKTYGD